MPFDGIVTVYDKHLNKIAIFPPNTEGISEEAKRNLLVSPTIRQVSNGESSLTFEVLSDSETWDKIKNIENLYHVNDKWYTVLSDDAYEYRSENGVSVVSVVALEVWSLLSKEYAQIYNCGLYVYAKARFSHMTTDGAVFTIYSYDCTNPGNTISAANAWEQVKTWQDLDANGNRQSYAILTADGYKSTGWEDTPSAVFLKSFYVSGNTATMTIESRVKRTVNQVFNYNASHTYQLNAKPLPASIDGIKVNSTVVTKNGKNSVYTTSDKDVYNYSYNASTGIVTINYSQSSNETISGFTVTYTENNLGKISPGATCWFAYGPEVVDETTVVILPKANTKYKLTINGTSYSDSQVRDSRGVVMPRGSGGYCMWALLKDTDWSLGVCDVIATGFNADKYYGTFNLEADQKSILFCIQTVAQLYGGILDWDSEHKILNYRAENYQDYQAYRDGFNDWAGMVFREGKNLTEKPVISVDNSLITKAYLLGYGNLNVKKVNGGRSYIENHSFTDKTYTGYLKQELIYDTNDEGGQKQLLYWGRRELAKQCKPRESVTLAVHDLRYLPEYSHEVFSLNDIVKVRYEDEHIGKVVEKEQRVIVWEYNAHALWESTVELGDVTLNKTDLFKLIYKKVNNNPSANNTGNIPGANIDLSGGNNSLTNYIQLIARTTTEDSDAIAGLILDTSENYARADLFAQYEKTIDGLLTKTYAGITAYADGEISLLRREATGHWEELGRTIDQHYLEQTILSKDFALHTTEMEAKWKENDEDIEAKYGEFIILSKDYSQYRKNMDQKWETNDKTIKAHYDEQITLSRDFSTLSQTLSQSWDTLNGEQQESIKAVTGAISSVTKDYALKTEFTGYQNTVNKALESSKTSITQYVDGKVGAIQLSAATYKPGDYIYNEVTGQWEYMRQNGIRFTVGSDAVIIENVRYPNEAFDNVDIPLDDFVPEVIKNAANLTFTLNSQLNGDGTWANPGLVNRINYVVNNVEGWRYTGSTMIDGAQIMTGTVSATKLEGGTISLLDQYGSDTGVLYLRNAHSHTGLAVELAAPAIAIYATDGDVWVTSERGNVQVKTQGYGNLELEGNDVIITRGYSVRPIYSGRTSLGTSAAAWTGVYSQSDVSVVSDREKKDCIDYDISRYMNFFDKLKPCSYKLKDGESGRTHIGMVAQDVEKILEECEIGSKDFAGFIKGKNEEEGSYDYMLRYGEFIPLCIAKIQEQDKRIAELEKLIKQ